MNKRRKENIAIPHSTFTPTLYRQPSLVEGPLKPSPYRYHGASNQIDSIIDRYSITSVQNNSIVVDASRSSLPADEENNPDIENEINKLLEGEAYVGIEENLSKPLL